MEMSEDKMTDRRFRKYEGFIIKWKFQFKGMYLHGT